MLPRRVLLSALVSLQLLFNASSFNILRNTLRRIRQQTTGINFEYNDENDDFSSVDSNQGGKKRMMSWPFNNFESPPMLTGELAADCGFDPLRIVKSEKELFALREAEVKHARLAMLGSLGWPVSELLHPVIAKTFGLPNLLQDEGKVPSVLNGGLENDFVILTLSTFLVIAALLEIELQRIKREMEGPEELKNFFNMFNEEGFDVPGNYQFDPLKISRVLCGSDKEKRKLIQTMEIFNGRMSMLAVVGYAAQEYFTGLPVIRETPEFFYPPWTSS